jgi:hypothetical protein
VTATGGQGGDTDIGKRGTAARPLPGPRVQVSLSGRRSPRPPARRAAPAATRPTAEPQGPARRSATLPRTESR